MITTNGKATISSNGLALTEAGLSASPATMPSLPRTLWTAWKAYGHRVATYQSELLLSAVYFLVLGPSGWAARVTGKNLLDVRIAPSASSYWIARKPADKSLPGMQRQY